MRTLKIVLSHPDARVDVWDNGAPPRCDVPGKRLDNAHTGSSFEVHQIAGQAVRFRAERGLTSSDDVYYSLRNDGTLTVSDSFRGILACTPPKARHVPQASIADHLLFRTTPGTQTYVAGIARLGHGDRLEWNGESGAMSVDRGARLGEGLHVDSDQATALDRLDAALETALGEVKGRAGWANLLSGGIDSTLVHTYFGASTPSISAASDSPEFANEVTYARTASTLLGSDHQFVAVREREYLADLEECIDVLALPPHHLQTVLIGHALRGGLQPNMVTAQLADALFGLGASLRAARAWTARSWVNLPGIQAVAGILGPSWAQRVSRWRDAHRALSLPVDHPDSFAARFAVFGDVDEVSELLGEELVRERFVARINYVQDRVELARTQRALDRQLEFGHWIDFFCDDTVSIWRQLAHVYGKRLLAPFTARSVVDTVFGFPVRQRYVMRGEIKPVLKSLLARRLPAYPIHQEKGGSGLPVARYFDSGPMNEVFNRYRQPDFVDRQRYDLLRQPAKSSESWMAWNIATFAIWQERVVEQSVTIPPSWRQLRWNSPEPRQVHI